MARCFTPIGNNDDVIFLEHLDCFLNRSHAKAGFPDDRRDRDLDHSALAIRSPCKRFDNRPLRRCQRVGIVRVQMEKASQFICRPIEFPSEVVEHKSPYIETADVTAKRVRKSIVIRSLAATSRETPRFDLQDSTRNDGDQFISLALATSDPFSNQLSPRKRFASFRMDTR